MSVTDATGSDTGMAERADPADGFTGRYERPQVVWSAPGRANLIGEHTDYNDGFVLPFAIAERTAVAAARRDDGVITVASTLRAGQRHASRSRTSPPAPCDGWAGYPLGVAWALGQVRARCRTGGGRRPVHRLRRAGRRAGCPPRPRSRWRPPARSPTCGGLTLEHGRARPGGPPRGERGRRRAHRGHGPVRVAARPSRTPPSSSTAAACGRGPCRCGSRRPGWRWC